MTHIVRWKFPTRSDRRAIRRTFFRNMPRHGTRRVAYNNRHFAENFREVKLWVFRKANIMPQLLLFQRVTRIFLRIGSRKPTTPDCIRSYLCWFFAERVEWAKKKGETRSVRGNGYLTHWFYRGKKAGSSNPVSALKGIETSVALSTMTVFNVQTQCQPWKGLKQWGRKNTTT